MIYDFAELAAAGVRDNYNVKNNRPKRRHRHFALLMMAIMPPEVIVGAYARRFSVKCAESCMLAPSLCCLCDRMKCNEAAYFMR